MALATIINPPRLDDLFFTKLRMFEEEWVAVELPQGEELNISLSSDDMSLCKGLSNIGDTSNYRDVWGELQLMDWSMDLMQYWLNNRDKIPEGEAIRIYGILISANSKYLNIVPQFVAYAVQHSSGALVDYVDACDFLGEFGVPIAPEHWCVTGGPEELFGKNTSFDSEIPRWTGRGEVSVPVTTLLVMPTCFTPLNATANVIIMCNQSINNFEIVMASPKPISCDSIFEGGSGSDLIFIVANVLELDQ